MRTRRLATVLLFLVVGAALCSIPAWLAADDPTESGARALMAALLPDETIASSGVDTRFAAPGVERAYVDLTGREDTGPFDDVDVEPLVGHAEDLGWRDVRVREAYSDDSDDEETLVGRIGNQVVDFDGDRLSVASRTPVVVVAATLLGALLGGIAGSAWWRLRQRARRGVLAERLRLAVASGSLPVLAVLVVAIPLSLADSPTATAYSGLVVGVTLLLAGLWVPVLVVVGATVFSVSSVRSSRAVPRPV